MTSIQGGQPGRVVLLYFSKGIEIMIINRDGAKFQYNGIIYKVGDKIVANGESEYEGLFGTITEIRDGDHRETCNNSPDIYCEFMPPFDPKEIRALESRFSCLYRQEKKLEDITLDTVILSPEMITVMNPAHETRQFVVYEIREEWISPDDAGVSIEYALDERQARRFLTQMVNDEKEKGLTPEWKDDARYKTEITSFYYEEWLDGEYCSNHYKAFICRHEMCLSHELFAAIGKAYVDMQLRKYFAEQIEDWEELEDLTEEQTAQMVASPSVPLKIRKQLEQNGYLTEAFWESVSEASFALVKKFKEGQL